MRTDTIDRLNEGGKTSVKRQIDIPVPVYEEVEDLVKAINRREGKAFRSGKLSVQRFLPIVVADGVKFHKQEFAVPYGMHAELAKNPEWVKARAELNEAIKKIKKLEKQLIKD